MERSLSDIAHDLRTPLSVIHSTSEALLIDDPAPEVRDALTIIIAQVGRLSELIGELSRSRAEGRAS
jgi:signal transduction histidine kinase